jgi:hypothetical protein
METRRFRYRLAAVAATTMLALTLVACETDDAGPGAGEPVDTSPLPSPIIGTGGPEACDLLSEADVEGVVGELGATGVTSVPQAGAETVTFCEYLAEDQPVATVSVSYGEPMELAQWRETGETVVVEGLGDEALRAAGMLVVRSGETFLTFAPGPTMLEGDQQTVDAQLIEMAQIAVANLERGGRQ